MVKGAIIISMKLKNDWTDSDSDAPFSWPVCASLGVMWRSSTPTSSLMTLMTTGSSTSTQIHHIATLVKSGFISSSCSPLCGIPVADMALLLGSISLVRSCDQDDE